MTVDDQSRIPSQEAQHCTWALRHYFTATAEQRALFFTPSFAGHYIARESFAIDRRLSHGYQLLLTVAGEGELTYDGRTVRLGTGSVMFIDLGEHHAYRALSDGWAFKYIHFDGAMSGQYFELITGRSGTVITPGAREFLAILEHTDAVLAGMASPGMLASASLSREIYAILTALIGCGERSGGVTDAQLAAVTDAAEYIRGHYREPLSVSGLAARCYLSRPYFSRLFSRLVGTAPHEYILLCRMSEAKRLLTETSLAVSEVGGAVGFDDASAFTRVFTRYHGMTPTQYRRRMK